MTKKHEDITYHEMSDGIIKDFLLGIFVDDIKSTHVITQLAYLPKENKWLIKLEKDYIKEM